MNIYLEVRSNSCQKAVYCRRALDVNKGVACIILLGIKHMFEVEVEAAFLSQPHVRLRESSVLQYQIARHMRSNRVRLPCPIDQSFKENETRLSYNMSCALIVFCFRIQVFVVP